jgi:predicted DCC family thiol-disulfide oxidoreductase YuxK
MLGVVCRFLSLHDAQVEARFPDLTHERMMEEMIVIAPDGKRYGGADGFRYLTLRIPRLWLLAPLMNFPGMLPVWSWCYRQVARRRYFWNKPEDCEGTCDLHFKKKIKEPFL